MTRVASVALVWLIGMGMGVHVGAVRERERPLPPVSPSQARAELALCMASVQRASEALDSVGMWIHEQGMLPITGAVMAEVGVR